MKTCPPGWAWIDNWHTDAGLGDEQGWFYGPDFKSLKAAPSSTSTRRQKGALDFVRRRRLIRFRERHTSGAERPTRGPERQIVGVVAPGGSAPLPWTSLVAGSNWCLQLRPHASDGHPAYKWSQVVPPASEYGARHGSNGQGEAKSRGATSGAFVLADLALMKEVVKQEELLECTSARESWWLCIEADPARLHSDVSAPVIDWRLTVRAPLQLENRLPAISEFIVWEKPFRAGAGIRPVSRHHGLVKAGESVHVYSIDIRCQLLLTWLPQGGWKHEKVIINSAWYTPCMFGWMSDLIYHFVPDKLGFPCLLQDAVVISDPWATDLPGNFWMVNAHSNRYC